MKDARTKVENYATSGVELPKKEWQNLTHAAEVARISIWFQAALKKAKDTPAYKEGTCFRDETVREVKVARSALGKETKGIPEPYLKEINNVLWNRKK